MNTIKPNMSQVMDQARYDLEGKDARAFSAQRFNASESQSADLEIVTAEGDRVTLSYGASESVGYSSYENLARQGGGFQRSAGQSLSFSREQEFSLTVEGDLSESELADINNLLSEIDGVMGDQTAAAIRDFERHFELEVTGVPSPALVRKLEDIGALTSG